jgi:ABC-type multidrug transport system fused ATPase/permease subunit
VDRNRTDFYCLLFFILGCIAFVAYISSGTAFGVTSTKLTSSIRVRTLHRLLHLDISWFSQQNHSVHGKSCPLLACLIISLTYSI